MVVGFGIDVVFVERDQIAIAVLAILLAQERFQIGHVCSVIAEEPRQMLRHMILETGVDHFAVTELEHHLIEAGAVGSFTDPRGCAKDVLGQFVGKQQDFSNIVD